MWIWRNVSLIESRLNLAESPGLRLSIALAISLLAHLALAFGISLEKAPSGFEESLVGPRISVAYRSQPQVTRNASDDRASRQDSHSSQLPESLDLAETDPAQPQADLSVATEVSSNGIQGEGLEHRGERLSIEQLRSSWREDLLESPSEDAPIRLTDAPGLDAQKRSYLSSWQREVQRVGRLNFPTDAKGNRLRGSLRLLVGIEADGSLAYARITESSGDKRLDDAALDIVRLAAPYAPLPPSLRRGNAVLEIERTWRIGASLFDL